MEIIKDMENNYRLAFPNDTVPYKYIPEMIKQLSEDMKTVNC